jgi:hypothetical protein
VKTIRGRNNANTHLKNPGWLFVCDAAFNSNVGDEKGDPTDFERREKTFAEDSEKKEGEIQGETNNSGGEGTAEGTVVKSGGESSNSGAEGPKRTTTTTNQKTRMKKVFLLISNYEAEKCSCLMSSGINFPTIDDHLLDCGTEVQDAYGRDEQTGRQFNRLRFCPRLYAFASVIRLHQAKTFLSKGAYVNTPISLHVFAGSIHADRALLGSIKNYLAIFPRPAPPVEQAAEEVLIENLDNMEGENKDQNKNESQVLAKPGKAGGKAAEGKAGSQQSVTLTQVWDRLFEKGYIERDGFVPQQHRMRVVLRISRAQRKILLNEQQQLHQPEQVKLHQVEAPKPSTNNLTGEAALDHIDRLQEFTTDELSREVLGNLKSLLLSPFQGKSPVGFLKDFYNNARHLDDELAMSSIGRLLGAAELGGTASEDKVWEEGEGASGSSAAKTGESGGANAGADAGAESDESDVSV